MSNANNVKNANQIVPAINQPVRAMKERFTLSGEPLPLSTCMRHLGLTLKSQSTYTECEYSHTPGHLTTYIRESGDGSWSVGTYQEDAEEIETEPTEYQAVLADMIIRYYQLKLNNPQVLASLGAYLTPLVDEAYLVALRDHIKSLYPVQEAR